MTSLLEQVRSDIYKYVCRIIVEGKEDWVKTNLGRKIENALANDRSAKQFNLDTAVEELKKGDPTPNGKFLSWIALQYANKTFKLGEDLGQIRRALMLFMKFGKDIPNKDINKYDLPSLYDTITPFLGRDEEATTPSEHKNNIKVIVDSPNLKVIVPLSKEASIAWGRGTQWCTAADDSKNCEGMPDNERVNNLYNNYNDNGPLYIIICDRGKFQLHGYLEDDRQTGEKRSSPMFSFMNSNDWDINEEDKQYLESFPEYVSFMKWFVDVVYQEYLASKWNLASLLYDHSLNLKLLASRQFVNQLVEQSTALKEVSKIKQQALNAVKIFTSKIASSLGFDLGDVDKKFNSNVVPTPNTFLENIAIDIAENQSDGSLVSYFGCVRSSATRFIEAANQFRREIDELSSREDYKMDFAVKKDLLINLSVRDIVDKRAKDGEFDWWHWLAVSYAKSIRDQYMKEIELSIENKPQIE